MDNALIADIINQFGYAGIAVLIALENIFPPIPSELILTFAGFLTLNSELTIVGTVIAATVGSVAGGAVLYWAGRLLSTQRLQRMVQGRFGRLVHLKATDIQKAERFFSRHGGKAVFFGRFVPIIRSLVSIPAGMTNYSFTRFLSLSLAGTFIWNIVLIYLGHLTGANWPQIVKIIQNYSLVVAGLLVVLMGVAGLWYWRRRAQQNS